jgi:hypothetical protein
VADFPSCKVEIAFATPPSNPPTWVDVTQWVQSFTIIRGRQRELNTIQTGTATVLLDNRDRRFDPSNTAGPYYPNVLPTRRIRISGTWLGVTTPQFTGFVDGWTQTWNGWADANVPLAASDGFKVLNFAQLNTSFVQERSDQRIGDVLSAIGWTIGGSQWVLGDVVLGLLGSTTILGPTGDRNLGVGTTQSQASILTQTSALTHMQDVAQTENGLLFMGKDGRVTFIGFNGGVATSIATFGEQELVYSNLTLAYDDNTLFNDIHVTRVGGIEQVSGDTAFQAAYFLRTLTFTNTLQISDSNALSLAGYLLDTYKQPFLEVIGMDLDGTADPTNLWPQILGREIGDLITVRRRPPGGGAMIQQVSMIQGIQVSYTAEGGNWLATWQLTAAVTKTPYWVLGDAVSGLLGSTTKLFF